MIKRIALFYAVALLLTVLLALGQEATGLTNTFTLPQWGPGLAALLMLVLFRRDHLSLRPRPGEAGWRRYSLALAAPLLGAVVLLPLASRLITPVSLVDGLRSLTPLWVAGMLFGALGEEIGWRGYLQPVVRGRWSALGASLLVGTLWGLWHMQSWANGPLYMLFLVLAMVGYSTAITALIDDVPGARIPLAALFHLGINLANVPFLTFLHQPAFMGLNAAIWLGLAVLAIYARRDIFLGRHSETGPAINV